MNKVKIKIPEFSLSEGMSYHWENDFEIESKIEDGVIKIIANKAGLISLANHFLNLAQDEIPFGHHLHFDQYNSLEDSSVEIIIEKK